MGGGLGQPDVCMYVDSKHFLKEGARIPWIFFENDKFRRLDVCMYVPPPHLKDISANNPRNV